MQEIEENTRRPRVSRVKMENAACSTGEHPEWSVAQEPGASQRLFCLRKLRRKVKCTASYGHLSADFHTLVIKMFALVTLNTKSPDIQLLLKMQKTGLIPPGQS